MEIENHRPHELDDETATLILQLQSRDIEELMSVNKGKGRDGNISDADLAVATYQQELQTMNVILADRCIGRSLTRAVISGAALLNESLAEENAAARDRVLAHSLAQVSGPPVAPEQTTAGRSQPNLLDPSSPFRATCRIKHARRRVFALNQ